MANINNADFTPTAPSFKKLVYLNMQKLTNFPYIEADFDALTNYGFLSKVVEYLNEVISNNNEQNDLMTALYNAYFSLQDYVNNYFDNLDIQDEINNKLDSMAQDGSLYNIIKPYIENEIMPSIENQNIRIDGIASQVNSLASGSPLVASSTSEMTDTTRTYVNTSDGKWYYYDGDSWEIGGTYQSTGIGINSVNPDNLNDDRFNSVFKFYTNNLQPISDSWQSGAWTGSVIIPNVNAISCSNVSLKTGDIISLNGDFQFAVYKGADNLRYYGTNDYTIEADGNNYAFVIVKDPREDITTYVNQAKNIVGLKNYKIELNEIGYNNLNNSLKENVDATIGTITLDNNTEWKPGYYNTSLEYIYTNGYSTYSPIPVEIGYKITANVNGASTVYTLFKCDEDGNLIEGLKTGTGNDPIEFTFNIDFNGYIGVTYRNVGIPNVSVEISKNVKNLQNQIDILNNFMLTNNSLYGCEYISEGDSITNRCNKDSAGWEASEGYTPYETPIINGYQNYLINKLNCTLTNYGSEGATIVSMLPNILNRDYSNYELVTIAFGVNDARTGVQLGDIGSYTDTVFNINTFTGAYRTAINHILTDNPNIKIILMTPIQRDFINNFGTDTPNINGDTLVDFRDRIIEIAKIYSLPVCDCFGESEINNYNIKSLTIDGVHPNNAGYKCMGLLLCDIINKL